MRDNYIGRQPLGFKKGGCVIAITCTGQPVGTFVGDNPSDERGPFYTRLNNVTLKLNVQLTPSNHLTFLGSFNDKRVPFRGGETPNAPFLNTDSANRQTFPELISPTPEIREYQQNVWSESGSMQIKHKQASWPTRSVHWLIADRFSYRFRRAGSSLYERRAGPQKTINRYKQY